MVQGLPEIVGRPGAQPAGLIGREVARIHRAKRRGNAAAARIGRAPAHGVAAHAVAGARQVGALADQGTLGGYGLRWAGGVRCHRRWGAATVRSLLAGSQRRQGGQWLGVVRQGLRGQPTGHRRHIGAAQLGGDVGHAVGCMGAALARLPAAELGAQVVARQAQQAGHVGRCAGEGAAVALGARGYVQLGIAVHDQGFAARQHRGGQRGGLGRGVGQIQLRKILGHLPQVTVGQRFHQARHQAVVTPTLAKVEQLVVQVAGGLAGQPRVVAVGPGAALCAVAGRAGQGALGHGVFKSGRRGQGKRQAADPQEKQNAQK